MDQWKSIKNEMNANELKLLIHKVYLFHCSSQKKSKMTVPCGSVLKSLQLCYLCWERESILHSSPEGRIKAKGFVAQNRDEHVHPLFD